MTKFNFKNRHLTSGPHLLGLLLILAGAFALLSPFLFHQENSAEKILAVGGGAILIGSAMAFFYHGVLIDFSKKRVKEYVSVFGYIYGDWKPLPVIRSVKVISYSYLSTNLPNGISPTFSGKVTDYKILLDTDVPEPLFVFKYSKEEKAVSDARDLAFWLEADLLLLNNNRETRQ